MCPHCEQQRLTMAAVLVHDLDRTQRALIRATRFAEARPRPTTESRVERLQVACSLLNAQIGDIVGRLAEEED
jgi:hypothetical protein